MGGQSCNFGLGWCVLGGNQETGEAGLCSVVGLFLAELIAMKNRLQIYAAMVLVLIGVAGCSVVPSIRGNGVKVSEEREVGEFHGLAIAGSGRAIITRADKESLEVEADENLLPYIEAEVRGGDLHIGMRGNLSFTEGPVFRIGVRNLDRLHLSGSLRAEVDRLEAERFEVGVSGSGNVQVGYLEAGE
ncbi:MAG: hypothetical protein RI897_4649, partial [Verrucomicrobiota bacterium]